MDELASPWRPPSYSDTDWVRRGVTDASNMVRVGLTHEYEGRLPYAALLTDSIEMARALTEIELPLLLAEGRIRHGLTWKGLARMSALVGARGKTPQALHKRYSARVRQIIAAAESWDESWNDDDFYTACGFL